MTSWHCRLSTRALVRLFVIAATLGLSACGETEEGAQDEAHLDGIDESSGGSSGAEDSNTGGGAQAVADNPSPVYVKASNAEAGDLFGVSVALSAQGDLLAVGASQEASSAAGVDGDRDNNDAPNTGAVYVFRTDESGIRQKSYLKASNSGERDAFGSTVALSADGSTLAVGAPFEASSATGVDGDQNDDSAPDAGAVYIFSRREDTWQQEAYLKASNAAEGHFFGSSIALSADGSRLAVGADGEDGADTGFDADQGDDSARDAGAVYLFERSGNSWEQEAYLKASNTDAGDHFGASVDLSSDGNTLAVGAFWEDSAATGIDGDEQDNSMSFVGAAYVFDRQGSSWSQEAYLKPSQVGGSENFGSSVSLANDGHTLAVGAAGDDSAATGIDGEPGDGSMPFAGAVYVFSREGSSWQQRAYIKASNTGEGDEFGHHIHLSGDGHTLAVGAALEASAGGDKQGDDSMPESGAVYLFGNEASSWKQTAYLKAPVVGIGDRFGWSMALADDGGILAASASREASAATGVNGDASDDSANSAGATYLYQDL